MRTKSMLQLMVAIIKCCWKASINAIYIGILHCWDTWLHCPRSSLEERLWNGVWLVGGFFSSLFLAYVFLVQNANFEALYLQRWSLGAIMYEMLVGYPPFYSDDPMSTCRKVNLFFFWLICVAFLCIKMCCVIKTHCVIICYSS